MRSWCLGFVLAAAIATLASAGLAQKDAGTGPYKVIETVKVGGEGGFDYISADIENRLLVMPRSGAMGGLTLYNLDTLVPADTIESVKSGGAVIDPKTHHGFSTTRPMMTMWDGRCASGRHHV